MDDLDITVEEPVVIETTEITEEDKAWEDRAKRMGWAPKEHWRGPPSRWRTAREFVEHAERTIPVLLERNLDLDRKFTEQTESLKEANTRISELSETLKQLHKWSQTAEQRAYDRARRDLEAQKRHAVATSDTDTYDRAQAELDALEEGRKEVVFDGPKKEPPKEPEAPQQPEQVAPSTTVQAWVRENSWWFEDPASLEMKTDAITLFGSITNTHPNWPEEDRLAETRRKIERMYPDKFRNPRRDNPSVVSSPSPPVRDRGPKKFGYDDLPREEKAACDRFVRDIPGYKREDYVAEYLKQENKYK